LLLRYPFRTALFLFEEKRPPDPEHSEDDEDEAV
jgi:hypothetical protein